MIEVVYDDYRSVSGVLYPFRALERDEGRPMCRSPTARSRHQPGAGELATSEVASRGLATEGAVALSPQHLLGYIGSQGVLYIAQSRCGRVFR